MNPQKLAKTLQEALALHQAGRLDEAAVLYARVRTAAPKNFDAANLAGTLQIQQGRFADAARTLAMARRLDPRSAVCAMRLGVALNALGRFTEAAEALGASVALDERLPEGWFHLGRALEQLGRVDEAIGSIQRALAARPEYAEAHDCLGAMLTQTQGHAAAEPHLRRATELEPNFARAWCNRGIALVYLGRLSEAVTCLDRALALDPQMHHAYAGRGLALERWHRIGAAVTDYGRALIGDPLNHQARSARLMALHYLSGISAETLRMEHIRFGELAEADLKPAGPVAFLPRTDTTGRLRVGFLSPNLRAHSVAYFLEPILEHLDRSRFEIYLYHDHPSVDATSARLRHHAAQWRQVAGQPNEALETILRGDQLDILVDLAGHTELNRLALLARRMAPVQATYLGYPDTTGLRTMDYRLVDGITDPLGESEEFCTERLFRFAPTAWCYAPPLAAPEPAPGPAAHGEPVTFGCFNNFAKVTDESMQAWGRILATVPGSRLLLKGFGLGQGTLRAEAQERLTAAAIDLSRVDLLDRMRSQADHLAAYARIDVSLDTFPYHGTTTTCEALWMGVPVVTLAGDRHASRVGVSLLKAAGHGDWVTRDWDDYVAVAGALAADSARLAGWRTGLRDDFRKSPLFDHAGQAARFGAALLEMWRTRPLEMPQSERRSA
jgi:predicted O-linked N-acetylglucosamine transferase (SPINDLY family)